MAPTYSDIIQSSDLPDALRTYYSAQLQFTAIQDMVFDQFAEVKNEFSDNHGPTVVWTIYRQMAATIGALTENVDVDANSLSDFQVSFGVNEYGNALGVTEKLDLLSYQGKISDVVRSMLAPQMALTLDILARNAAWAGAPKFYASGTTRAGLTESDVATIDLVKQGAYRQSINRIPLVGGNYTCVCHPAVIYDLKEDSLWENPGVYSDPARLATGEVGRIHGVRFIESHNARLPNAGASSAETTTTAAVAFNASGLTVASTTGIAAGDEITLYPAANSTPDGTDPSEESVTVQSVTDSTHLVLTRGTLHPHASGCKVRKGVTIYPLMFQGGTKAYGKGVFQAPEVRVALPTDRLRRMHFIGWYALLGYGTIRNWAYHVIETAASRPSNYVFGSS